MQYCYIVRIRSLRSLLFTLALLTTLLSPGTATVWYCDGRICSTGAECCCLSLKGQQDAQCQNRASAESKNSLCSASCRCKLRFASEAPRSATLSTSYIYSPHFSILSVPTAPFVAAPATEIVFGCIETRGPPRSPLLFRTLSLRAPPIA